MLYNVGTFWSIFKIGFTIYASTTIASYSIGTFPAYSTITGYPMIRVFIVFS